MLIALLLQSVPPPMPPEPDRMTAALALIGRHPPSAEEERSAIEDALWALGRQTLAEIDDNGITPRWVRRVEALRARYRVAVPTGREPMRGAARTCLATPLAYALPASDLEAADRFFATPAGKNFWTATRLGTRSLAECYAGWLRERIDVDGGLRSLGLRPPKRSRPWQIVY